MFLDTLEELAKGDGGRTAISTEHGHGEAPGTDPLPKLAERQRSTIWNDVRPEMERFFASTPQAFVDACVPSSDP